ncbi:MAG TPA: NADH-quinone oxidoreductase subunit J [Candidatus Deferrimicrobium sp.]|nr:NADH-quinone oxidoreductase subunit J [Candidatus Deferrimicrobium sp.]
MPEPSVGPVFWILSFVALLSAFMVVSLRNIFHCALFLILCLFCVAGIYILLDAEFLAAAQVLIYIGGISVLIIFAIMLTSSLASKKITQTNENALVSFFIALVFAFTTLLLVGNTHVWRHAAPESASQNTLSLGQSLMTEFMLPFEVVSVLLLAALIGAIVLARKERS